MDGLVVNNINNIPQVFGLYWLVQDGPNNIHLIYRGHRGRPNPGQRPLYEPNNPLVQIEPPRRPGPVYIDPENGNQQRHVNWGFGPNQLNRDHPDWDVVHSLYWLRAADANLLYRYHDRIAREWKRSMIAYEQIRGSDRNIIDARIGEIIVNLDVDRLETLREMVRDLVNMWRTAAELELE